MPCYKTGLPVRIFNALLQNLARLCGFHPGYKTWHASADFEAC